MTVRIMKSQSGAGRGWSKDRHRGGKTEGREGCEVRHAALLD